ncbi:hypothetical protein B0T18DRAFT_450482 [Schizothecium vesticola]|uniref:NADH dehydrogenase [ubiquinone] 1 alpha subcomplex subunit n=1 Tax=Schizothecium vesticola TaxID=314040 RepID=A0AA40EEI1_9PEZI|nr:hypothetical protein B0T18DRAFT_450482 [Schizothecium vesticola]
MDLHGNTFWEFSPPGAAATDRRRRIVQYPAKVHHADVTVSPAWHQWLRNTRAEPPSIEEQRADVVRQERMKVLAAEADARWAAKPRVMDAPRPKQEIVGGTVGAEGTEGAVGGRESGEVEVGVTGGRGDATEGRGETWQRMKQRAEREGGKPVDDPWKRSRGGPSEEWQPEEWQPKGKKSP